MLRIYLIEDYKPYFQSLTEHLLNVFTSQLEILPVIDDPRIDSFLRWNKLIDYIRTEAPKPDAVADTWMEPVYQSLLPEKIDYYIIDNCLLPSNKDNTGIAIAKFLYSKNVPREKIILFTMDPDSIRTPELDAICVFITKHTDGREGLVNYLQQVALITKSKNITEAPHPGTNRKLKEPGMEPEWQRKIKVFFDQSIAFCLRALTICALAMGLSLTFVSGSSKFHRWVALNSFRDSTINSHSTSTTLLDTVLSQNSHQKPVVDGAVQIEMPAKKSHENEKQKGMLLLQFIEELFLNFLPFFILFGFLAYYNHYLTSIWRATNDKTNPRHSMQSLKISKSLFISSIIATLIINILERLIDSDSFNSTNLALKLLPHFIFILMLCLYFFRLEKDEGSE